MGSLWRQGVVLLTMGALLATGAAPASGADWTLRTVGDSIMLGISCPTNSRCVATGAGNTVLSSDDPTAGSSGWNLANVGAGPQGSYFSPSRAIRAVDCPTAGFCVGVSYEGWIYTSTNPTGPAGAWTPTQGKGTVQITDVDCPTASRCVAIDNNADVLTSTDPTGGAGAWTFQNLLPYREGPGDTLNPNGTFGVSCPTTSFCAIAATQGQILTSTNPFDPPPAEAKAKPKKKRKHKGPKRPRVIIAHSPPPGIEIPRGKTKVRFRFYAANHASVRGYVCKLDRRKFKPCKSPKHYRVGFGKHRFTVRAVDWTGHRGKAAYDPFEVCHPTRYGNCVEHLPPPVAAGSRR